MARKGLNQEKIIEVAVELVEVNGYSKLTLTDLAHKLEIKTASIYNHFNNIEEIQCAVGVFAVKALKAALRAAIDGKYRRDAIIALADTYRSFNREHAELYKAFIALHVVHDELTEQHIRNMVEEIFAAMSAYELTDEQRIHWERTLRSTMHGFAAYEDAGWFRSLPAALDDSYCLAIRNILASMEAMERMNNLRTCIPRGEIKK